MRAWGYVFVVLYTSLQGWLVSSAPLVPSESVGAKSDSCRVHTFYYMWYGEPKVNLFGKQFPAKKRPRVDYKYRIQKGVYLGSSEG